MDVANEILDAIEIIVDKKIKEQTTQIYPGICKSVNGNSCVISINGKDNTVQFYGSAPNVGAIYRVFVPYGNMSMAFIITTNGSGSSTSGVSSVNGLTGDVNLTASSVGAWPRTSRLSRMSVLWPIPLPIHRCRIPHLGEGSSKRSSSGWSRPV